MNSLFLSGFQIKTTGAKESMEILLSHWMKNAMLVAALAVLTGCQSTAVKTDAIASGTTPTKDTQTSFVESKPMESDTTTTKEAQPDLEESGAVESGTTFAKDALTPYVESGQLPGCIAVFYKDGIQETTCMGYADVAQKRPITMKDVYMQSFQTQGFCGVTIAILVEEGKLSLDDPVSKYLPEFEELWILKSNKSGVKTLVRAKNTLTVRMVMNHTGGFPFEICAKQGGIKGGGWSGGAPLRQAAAMAADSPIMFEPGTKANYSNTGIDIGAAVVEVITGKHWEDFLKERVLDPLGMTSTWFWPTNEQLKTQVEMYDCVKDKPAKYRLQNNMQQRPYNDRHVFVSAGAGLWTTAADQLKFYKMLMNLGVGENGARILKPETVKELLAKSSRPKGLDGYSLGLRAPVEDKEDSWFGHGGAWGTNCSVNWHRKELKLWVVQLCGGPRPWDIVRREAENIFFKYMRDKSGTVALAGRMK